MVLADGVCNLILRVTLDVNGCGGLGWKEDEWGHWIDAGIGSCGGN